MKFYPDMTDQIAHALAAFFILIFFAGGGVLGGALAGLGCGLIREFSEAGGSRIALDEVEQHFAKRDPWVDLAFWALGGALAGLVVS